MESGFGVFPETQGEEVSACKIVLGVGPESGGRGLDELFGVQALRVIGFECFFKPMLISYGQSILAKHRDPDWSPYDLTY